MTEEHEILTDISSQYEANELQKKVDKQEKKGLHYLDLEDVDVRRAFRCVSHHFHQFIPSRWSGKSILRVVKKSKIRS